MRRHSEQGAWQLSMVFCAFSPDGHDYSSFVDLHTGCRLKVHDGRSTEDKIAA